MVFCGVAYQLSLGSIEFCRMGTDHKELVNETLAERERLGLDIKDSEAVRCSESMEIPDDPITVSNVDLLKYFTALLFVLENDRENSVVEAAVVCYRNEILRRMEC